MSTAKYIGRVGALAVALGIGFAIATPAGVATAEAVDSADSTALIVCGTACPTPDEYWVESAMNQFITPTHPDQTITPVAVTTPEEYWPVTGLARLAGLVVGDPRIFGPGGPGWPDEPWWKLSGLFDLTGNQSLQAGLTDLETAMTQYGNDHLVIYAYSQGAAVAILEKRKLAEQYPAGTPAPDIDFVLGGDTNLPNGGLAARFPGLYIPVLDVPFNGPEPTDTQFHTDVITRQYDLAADFPLYPLNVIADLNAVLGFLYLHSHPFDVSLPLDQTTSPAYQGAYGDTSYYFFETEDLPLFAPLRSLGVPESLIDVVEPFFRTIVELGYDRSIPPWEPTPARLIPPLNPVSVVTDLVDAVGEGVNNAVGLLGLPAPLNIPVTAPATAVHEVNLTSGNETRKVDVSSDMQVRTEQMSTDTAASVTHGAVAAASAPEPSADDTTPDPAKPAERPKPRSVMRDSLKAGEPEASLSHHRKRNDSMIRTTAADDGTAMGESSSAASSSPDSKPSGGDSSGGDASGAE